MVKLIGLTDGDLFFVCIENFTDQAAVKESNFILGMTYGTDRRNFQERYGFSSYDNLSLFLAAENRLLQTVSEKYGTISPEGKQIVFLGRRSRRPCLSGSRSS